MLVITRRLSEKFRIGDDVSVSILSIKGNQVNLGIDAPRDVPVHREEVYQRIQAEKYAEEYVAKIKQLNLVTE